MTTSVAVALTDRLELRLAARLLEAAGYDVVLATVDGAVVLARSRREPAAVTVISHDLAAVSGGVIAPLLATGTRVLVVGSRVEAEDVAVALLQGASGFLDIERASPEQLAGAVADVAAGSASLHPDAARYILQQWRDLRRGMAASKSVTLTVREREVLAALAQGAAAKQMARRFGISEKTVEAHKARVYAKLGVTTQGQAVSEGMRLGLIGDAAVAAPDR